MLSPASFIDPVKARAARLGAAQSPLIAVFGLAACGLGSGQPYDEGSKGRTRKRGRCTVVMCTSRTLAAESVGMTLTATDIRKRLNRHLEAFNRGVRTGDFTMMFDMYHRDAVFVLSDPVWVVHQGLEAIRRAYRGDPPQGTMRLGGATVTGQSVTADYIWDAEPDRIAGTRTLEFADGQVIRELVTFADD